MKTKEEIEQLAFKNYGDGFLKGSFIHGYTQCQEDMADYAIKFAQWLVGDIDGNGATEQELQDNTTSDLYTLFLNKQD